MTRIARLMQRVAAGAVTVVLAIAVPAQAQADSLADAMAGAYTNSGLLEQNRALLRAADEDVAVAVSRLRPILSWSASATRNFGNSFTADVTPPALPGVRGFAYTETQIGLTAEWLLYDGGRTKMGVDVAKETVLATRQALVSIEQRVLLSAVQAFMEVRRTSEIAGLRRNNIRVINEELRAARDRFEVGEVTRTDVALTEARLAGAQSALAQADGERAIAIETYRAVVGRAPGNLKNPPVLKSAAASADAAKSLALSAHPDLRQVQHQVTAADLGVLIARANTTPQAKLRGTLGVNDRADSRLYTERGTIGVEIGGPIYQGGQLRALARKSIAQRDQQRGLLHITRTEIAQNAGTAYARLQVARAALAATDEQIRAARVAFQGVREEATLGARTTLDVLNAEQELLDAQANRVTAASNQTVAQYALLAAMGQLTVDTLNLNVPRYDPAAYYNLVKDAPAAGSRQGKQLDRVLERLGKQ